MKLLVFGVHHPCNHIIRVLRPINFYFYIYGLSELFREHTPLSSQKIIFIHQINNVEVIEDCPTTESKVVGLYFLAETIKSLITLKLKTLMAKR